MIATIIIMGGIAVFFGLLLGFANKKFRVEEDPRVEKVYSVLPHLDCGSCGFAGCMEYAKAVAAGEKINRCKPGGQKVADKIGEIVGRKSQSVKLIARVHCHGGVHSLDSSTYEGPKTCLAASIVGSYKKCKEGCMGFGDCVAACKFGAISIGKDGFPEVDEEKCTGCGACVRACPHHLIMLTDAKHHVWIGCSSNDPLKAANCKTGCIGCGICEKECPEGAIKMVDKLPVIDYSKCTNCMVCVQKCPRKIIKSS